jgi:Taurine catabolism dioxygenase TauD, TfdA family
VASLQFEHNPAIDVSERDMQIHNMPINPDCAWRSGAIGGKEGLVCQLGEAHLRALDALLSRTAHLRTFADIKRVDFDHPAVNDVLQRVSRELSDGRGAVIIRGVTPERYSYDEFERIFWGVGLHLGIAVPQTSKGDLIDHIRDMPDNPKERIRRRKQYGNDELTLHTDNASGEILGLMTVQMAKSGGVSQIASALAIHNEILATRPDLLEPLYRGYPYNRKGRQAPGEPNVAPFNTPLFCNVDGLVSCRYVREFMELAAQEMGVALPADLVEALDCFNEVAYRDDMSVRFTLERGEIMFINNLTCLHARTLFEDYDEPERKRHLLRLWMKVSNGRPHAPQMDMFWNSRIDHAAPAVGTPVAADA